MSKKVLRRQLERVRSLSMTSAWIGQVILLDRHGSTTFEDLEADLSYLKRKFDWENVGAGYFLSDRHRRNLGVVEHFLRSLKKSPEIYNREP